MDTLHLGDYWPVQEGEGRRRRPPARLGVEEERGYWEENLPRELSMGDPSSRQLTPHPSPPPLEIEIDRFGPFDAPAAEYHDAPEHQHLPASRSWDTDEIDALQLDRSKPPRCNLVCIHHFCPDLAGEDEPVQMEETWLATDYNKTM